MITVTKSYTPDINKYSEYLNNIFGKCVLTNNGPLVQKLEERLSDFLGVKNILVVNNGTVAIQIAITALVVKWLSHHSSKVIFLVRVQAGVDL